MRKICSIFVAIAMICALLLPASAKEIATEPTSVCTSSIYMSTDEKLSFMERMDAKFETDSQNGNMKTASREVIDNLIMEASFASGAEKDKISQELATYGIYIFNTESTAGNMAIPRIGTGDVTLNTPLVVYDSLLKSWIVTCGGVWNNNNFDVGYKFGNIGGEDAFGVGYTNIASQYKSSVVKASGMITDDSGDISLSKSNRSDGDGSKGFGFRLQDYTVSVLMSRKYVGYKWYGSCTYDINFASYSGIATAYYVHTWNSAEITSIRFGLEGRTAGVEISVDVSSKSFTAFSSDKIFGTAYGS